MNKRFFYLPAIFIIFFFQSFLYSEGVNEYIRFFSSVASRMPGTEGHKQSADFIESKFRAAGLKNIHIEEFKSVVPVEKYAYIVAENAKIDIHCLWPNLARTSTVPSEGITGKLIYGGNGDLRNLTGKDIEGSILVLDFDSGTKWQTLSMLGVKAFIFTETGALTRIQAEQKFVDIPVDIPRFYAHKNSPTIINLAYQEKEVQLFGRMDWESVPDYNIFGYIEGRNNELKEEIIILQAYYDGIGVVPAIASSASSAAGISVLLDVLDHLTENPPARTVMFLATSAHFQKMSGINDFIQRHLRQEPLFKRRIPQEDIVNAKLFIGLDLSDGSESLGIWHNSYDFYAQRVFAPYGRKFMEYKEQVSRKLGYNPETSLVNGISPERGIIWQTFFPEKIRTDGELVVLSGNAALSFVTVNDGRWRVDTPADTYANLNVNNIERQSRFIKEIFENAVNDPGLIPDIELGQIRDNLYSLKTKIVTFDHTKSFIPSEPVVNALVVPRIHPRVVIFDKTSMGVRNTVVGMTDESGKAVFSSFTLSDVITMSAFGVDRESGEIVLSPDLGVGGAGQYPVDLVMDYKEKDWMIVLFNSKTISLTGLIDPQYLVQLDKIEVLDMANSVPSEYGHYLQYPDSIPYRWSSYSEPLGCVFARSHIRVKVLGQAGPLGKRLLLLNSEKGGKEESEGVGFEMDKIPMIHNTPYQAAKDMIILDAHRKENFEQYGIKNERLAELQNESGQLLLKAEEAREKKEWYDFLKYSRQSQAVESRAYPDVKNTVNDVVKGLIFYFILLLPFAFFGERLLFSFTKLEKRIAGTVGIFIVIYGIMRMVHPAFKLTNAPEVILLSFIVLALSLIVLSIIASKFEGQMKQLKTASSGVYETDVGRVTATATAFSLGVANMKRRPTRTILTAITLVLLTFTVLSFTSIKSYMKYNQIMQPYKPAYQGILLRDRSWAPLMDTALDYVDSEFSGQGVIVPRAWFILEELGNRTSIEIRYGKNVANTAGLLGFSPQEFIPVKDAVVKGEWFKDSSESAVLLSKKTASELRLTDADIGRAEIVIYGKEFVFNGIFDEKALNEVRDLDNERVTPVDFSVLPERELLKVRLAKSAQIFSSQVKLESFVHAESENIAIVPYETLMNMKGTLQSIAVRFNDDLDGKGLVEKFISKLAVIVFTGLKDKTFVYSSMGLTSFSGISSLIIPILIAAMIVLNTMLGAVYERIREIGTYSAVGLAPSHISSLFLAESMVYAVIGAVAGYLLGQVVVRVLMMTDMLKGLVLNYSSLSAVFATIIIFITVILSTLYPAKKAAQMAVPDVTRKWILPEPEGDKWEFEFPFTVAEAEVIGLTTFLSDYFNSYRDVSLGNFYTKGATFSHETLSSDKNKYTIKTEVWLAPFDLGVSQYFNVVMEPMGEHEFYTINLLMARSSGESTDWKRLNRRFIDGIRKQFLIWRTLSGDVKQDYATQGKKSLNLA